MMMTLFTLLSSLFLLAIFNFQGPLTGPLIAVDTAAQDRIVLYDVSNMTRRELSFGPDLHRVWGFSADGCRIALTLDDGSGLPGLYSARIDGGNLRPLVNYDELPPGNWGVWEPQWSPDGEKIAFTMIRDQPLLDGTTEREYHIAWVDANGGAPQFYSVSGDEHEPRWSPDGGWLAYMAYDERVAGADIQSTAEPTREPAPGQAPPQLPLLREADLWVVSADGETKFRLTTFPVGSARGARWSPDGYLIGFTYSPSPSNDQFWMIAAQPDAIATQLSAEWSLVLDTTWLPDSSAMIAAVRDFQGTSENLLWRIPLVGLADTDATPLVNPDLGYADYPRFSADGRWLAFRSAYSLALIDTTNQSWAILDEHVIGNTPPVWSPPGFAGELACQG
jgi:Tol biopolymer transport system component